MTHFSGQAPLCPIGEYDAAERLEDAEYDSGFVLLTLIYTEITFL